MSIWGYVGNFKIKSKKDAERFLNMFADDGFICGKDTLLYWSDGEEDYCLTAASASVATRPVAERGNIFSPYFDEGKGYIDLIWKTRKHINKRFFSKEY